MNVLKKSSACLNVMPCDESLFLNHPPAPNHSLAKIIEYPSLRRRTLPPAWQYKYNCNWHCGGAAANESIINRSARSGGCQSAFIIDFFFFWRPSMYANNKTDDGRHCDPVNTIYEEEQLNNEVCDMWTTL